MAKGKKWYYAGWLDAKRFEACSTEKAFYLYYDLGYCGEGHEKPMWFPKSQCIFGDVNEVGQMDVYIPCWIIDNNPTVDVRRLDFNYKGGRIQL